MADGGELPETVCVLERDTTPTEPLRAAAAAERFTRLVTAMRLFKPGAVSLGQLGWWRAGEARWSRGRPGRRRPARGEDWILAEGDEDELRDFSRLCDEQLSRRRDELGAGALRDGLLAADRGRGAVGLPAVPARAAGRHRPTPVRRAWRCAWPRSAPRRASGASCSARSSSSVSLERFIMGGGGRARREHPRRVSDRAGRRARAPPARAAARHALRLPRPGSEGRRRRHPAGVARAVRVRGAGHAPCRVRAAAGARIPIAPATEKPAPRSPTRRSCRRWSPSPTRTSPSSASRSGRTGPASRRRWSPPSRRSRPSTASRRRRTGASTTPRTSPHRSSGPIPARTRPG